MELKMKKIENFGDFIASNAAWVALVLLFFGICVSLYDSVHTVKISDKEFRCAEASPDGLGTKCDVYVRRVK
jgi:hypothetical protein